jgi:hypothetical protein
VVFAPDWPGARAASLALTDDAPNSPQTLSLAGTGTGSTNASYVHSAYVAMLGHDADPVALTSWLSRLDAGTSRSADSSGLAYWTQAILGGAGDEQILAFVLSSDEFFASH